MKYKTVIPILIALSIIVQQVVFYTNATDVVLLMHVSNWVLTAPIWMLWILYALAPFIYVRPLSGRKLIRSYATAGWIFAVAAYGWTIAYDVISEKEGTPVNWNSVEKFYQMGMQQYDDEQNKQTGRQNHPTNTP